MMYFRVGQSRRLRADVHGWSRRRFLHWGAGLGLPSLALPADEAEGELVPFSDYNAAFRVEAQAGNPRVKCFDLRQLRQWITASSDFFTFHQTETIEARIKDWRLSVGGLVARPAEFTLDGLLGRTGRRDVAMTLECSGNSGDKSIMNGLVSTAVWTGVGLAEILRDCGVSPEAREVVFFGMDNEPDKKWEAANAEFSSPHGWSIFVQDALSPAALLAFVMNGKPLTAEQGFPLRLILPGWYGMAQVKWLNRIEVVGGRYEGRHMARNYQSLRAVETPAGTLWLDTSISRNNLKSVIARVIRQSGGGRFRYRIAGAAWGGPAGIEKVEVRIDGGPWRAARIDQRNGDFAWLLWSLDWTDAAPGRHELVSRAINRRGDIQPTREELRARLISNREDSSQWPRFLTIP
jgi:DMSO/TMAO reductase YedYZ molybdopterin-dependent catalytic subunit